MSALWNRGAGAGSAAAPQGRELALAAWEALLCWGLAACCALTAAGALFSGPQVTGNPLLSAALPGALAALLQLRALGGRWRWLAPLLAAAVALAAAAAAAGAAPPGELLADTPDNPLPFTLLAIGCAVAAALLSRSVPGSIALALCAVLLCGAIEFFYEQGRLTLAAGALLCALGLVLSARYRAAMAAQPSGSCPPAALVAASAALCVLSLALGLGGYAALNAAFELPKLEPKLITQEMALEEVEVEGISSTELVYDEDQAAQQERPSDWLSQVLGEQSSTQEEDPSAAEQPGGAFFQAISGLIDPEAWSTTASTVRYQADPLTWVLLLALLAAAVAGLVAGKRAARRRWFRRTCKLPPQEQAREFFRFFMQRFERLGMRRHQAATVEEFRQQAAAPLQQLFSAQPQLLECFDQGCSGFSQAYYGEEDPSPQSLEAWQQLYRGFYPCCAAHLGRLRYALRFLRL